MKLKLEAEVVFQFFRGFWKGLKLARQAPDLSHSVLDTTKPVAKLGLGHPEGTALPPEAVTTYVFLRFFMSDYFILLLQTD